MPCNRAIGVFDSGVGGLSVLKYLIQMLPNEQFVYFGDTARLPYGDKSAETIIRYSQENAQFLLQHDVKMIVVACNTASAHALETLEQQLPIPIVGVIEPGVESALAATKSGRIAVLGTKGTIASQVYQQAILHKNPRAFVLPIACPLLVPLIEENYLGKPAAQWILRDYLSLLKEHPVDAILLGCTHYPALVSMIRSEVDPDVVIVDAGAMCANKVARLLHEYDLQAESKRLCRHLYFSSDDPMKLRLLGECFLGAPIGEVSLSQARDHLDAIESAFADRF